MRTMIKLIGLMVLAMCELGGMPLASHAQGSVQIFRTFVQATASVCMTCG